MPDALPPQVLPTADALPGPVQAIVTGIWMCSSQTRRMHLLAPHRVAGLCRGRVCGLCCCPDPRPLALIQPLQPIIPGRGSDPQCIRTPFTLQEAWARARLAPPPQLHVQSPRTPVHRSQGKIKSTCCCTCRQAANVCCTYLYRASVGVKGGQGKLANGHSPLVYLTHPNHPQAWVASQLLGQAYDTLCASLPITATFYTPRLAEPAHVRSLAQKQLLCSRQVSSTNTEPQPAVLCL
jgi:hypothetical protein